MGFCDNCKTCGFFYDTSRNDLCPKCVVMAAEKDTSKDTSVCDEGKPCSPFSGHVCSKHARAIAASTQTDSSLDRASIAHMTEYERKGYGTSGLEAESFRAGARWQDHETSEFRRKTAPAVNQEAELLTSLRLCWSSFQEIVLQLKDVQTPSNKIAIACNNIAVDAQVRIQHWFDETTRPEGKRGSE